MENSLSLNMSRIFKCDAKTLFNAIGEGMLFKSCGALDSKTTMDFKVGGKFHAEWSDSDANDGEFLEINPVEKIVFTWDFFSKSLKRPMNTVVTIDIVEIGGKSTLTLNHSGFGNVEQVEEHCDGWDDGLNSLRKMFKELYAKIEQNPLGLDLHFKMNKKINAPVNKVFQAVIDNKQQQQYFVKTSSAPFIEGKDTLWTFNANECGSGRDFILHIQQVIKNKLVQFQWNEVEVCFSFREITSNETMVTIEATGFKPNDSGLEDSYSECEGWMDYLWMLKRYVEQS